MNTNKLLRGHKLTVKEAIVCFVVLMITGCGFLGMHINSNDVIDRAEATEITASYESFDYSYARGGYIHYIVLEFSDADSMTVDGSCASWELIDIIREMSEGTQLHMLIDESSNLIFELRCDDSVLISFDDAVNNISYEKTGLAVLGIITIAGGLVFMVWFLRKNSSKR